MRRTNSGKDAPRIVARVPHLQNDQNRGRADAHRRDKGRESTSAGLSFRRNHATCGQNILRYRDEIMDTIQDQLQELKVSVRRQRLAIIALASVLTGIALVGAVSPAGDATFDTITCKTWRVVDKDGKIRIGASALPDGMAGMMWFDKDGKERISVSTKPDGWASVLWSDKDGKGRIGAGTLADGQASVVWSDKDGKVRIAASTLPDGEAGVTWFDTDGKERILADTLPNGMASVMWLDKDKKARIGAATLRDGAVVYPTKDGR